MQTAHPHLKARFGALVRTSRNRLGISQEELAGRAGLHRTYVADIERGARNPSLESIDKLAAALEMTLAGLFTPSNEKSEGEGVDILMVEDDPRDIELTLRAFHAARLTNRIHIARDGVEALAYMFGTTESGKPLCHAPRVILLDLNLPKIDGRVVLQRLRDDPRTQSVPVVVLTVSERSRDIDECKRLGANAYIVKPVDFQRLCRITPSLNLSWLLTASGVAPRT